MSRSYQKICALLAASNFNENEIFEFISNSQINGPYDAIRHIMDMRHLITNGLKNNDFGAVDRGSMRNYELPYDFEEASETERKIVHLLLEDAGLPKIIAISLITQELEKKYGNIIIPHENRKGFANWVRRLLKFISESELLHIATKIRNEYVHDIPSDWRLSKN